MIIAQLLDMAGQSVLNGLVLGFSFRLGWLLASRLVLKKAK